MSRGRHNRDQVEFSGSANNHKEDYCIVMHEEDHPVKGKVMIIELGTFSGWEFTVAWRVNRNMTTGGSIFGLTDQTFDSVNAAIAAIPSCVEHFEIPEFYLRKQKRGPRDSQKKKVYAWERAFFNHKKKIHPMDEMLAKKDCKRFFQMVVGELDDGNRRLPDIRFRSGGRYSHGDSVGIEMLPEHCRKWVIIHELAHTYSGRWGTDRNAGAHCAGFVGTYIYLLARFCDCDVHELKRTAKEAKVQYTLPDQFFEWRASELNGVAA